MGDTVKNLFSTKTLHKRVWVGKGRAIKKELEKGIDMIKTSCMKLSKN